VLPSSALSTVDPLPLQDKVYIINMISNSTVLEKTLAQLILAAWAGDTQAVRANKQSS
jgi:hypothetical protein